VSIMLEVKKFINSEYIGQYAEIDFPVEAEEVPAKKEKKPKKAAKPRKARRIEAKMALEEAQEGSK